jgi:hypothetical protein
VRPSRRKLDDEYRRGFHDATDFADEDPPADRYMQMAYFAGRHIGFRCNGAVPRRPRRPS